MRAWIKRWGFPVAVAAVLLTGIFLQLLARMQPVPEPTLTGPLAEAVPAELAGWEVVDLDLGPTESVTQRSYDLLKLDDFVHRRYSRGGRNFTVYVAYWKPGKMPVRLVNQHTPDRCWTEAGWVCTDRRWNIVNSVEGQPLQPGQWGIYELGDYRNHTWFWHIVGGEVHWYGGERINTRTSLSTVWEDFRKFGLNVHREQFFVRIVSPEPMEDLWTDPGFEKVVAALADLCLAPPTPGQTVAAR